MFIFHLIRQQNGLHGGILPVLSKTAAVFIQSKATPEQTSGALVFVDPQVPVVPCRPGTTTPVITNLPQSSHRANMSGNTTF